MAKARLKAYVVTEYNFINSMLQGAKIKFESTYSYNVKYTPNGTCRAELGIDVHDKEHPEMFSVKATLVGFFDVDNTIAKEDLHLETYHIMFPIMKSIVCSMTAVSGVPPVMIPDVNIDDQNIYRIDVNDKEKK